MTCTQTLYSQEATKCNTNNWSEVFAVKAIQSLALGKQKIKHKEQFSRLQKSQWKVTPLVKLLMLT